MQQQNRVFFGGRYAPGAQPFRRSAAFCGIRLASDILLHLRNSFVSRRECCHINDLPNSKREKLDTQPD
jgi:hypothetical protein